MSGAHFKNEALVPNRYEGMMESWREIIRVEKLLGIEDIPVYKGCTDALKVAVDGSIPEVIPEDCEAVDNIIKTADEADELIYVMVTGTATNISSAIAKAPRIKDKICVIWLGSNHVDNGGADEFNMGQDRTAGRYLMNCGVNLVWVPAMSSDSTKGTQVLKTGKAFLQSNFTGTDAASSYFREDLPLEHDGYYATDTSFDGSGKWWHIFWDVAGVTVLDRPDLCS
jgi:inosine-uridine nucleoside N-ribohydrolase